MSKKNLFIFCFLLFASFLYSQKKIDGKILCQDKLNFSDIHIHIGKKVVTADLDGNYSAENMASQKTAIHISYIGYQTIDTVVEVKSNLKLDFKLKPSTTSLQEIVVHKNGNHTTTSVSEQILKRTTIERYSSQSLGDALKEIPGVSTLKTGNTVVKPIIHGLYGSRVPILNNNVRLEDQQWGIEHAPNFDINAANKITVIKGATGLQYGGDAIGGIVLIEPLSAKNDTLFGKTILNYDSNSRGGSIFSDIHKGNSLGWRYNALASLKYSGDRETKDYVLSNSGNREANFSGDIKYVGPKFSTSVFYSLYKTAIGILSASHIGDVTDLYYAIANKVPFKADDFTYTINNPKQEVTHHIGKFNFDYFWNEQESFSFQYAFQYNNRLEYDIRRGDAKNKAALDLDLQTHSFNLDYNKKSHDWTTKYGLNTLLQNNSPNATGIRPLIPFYDKVDFGAYSLGCYHFSDTFTIDGGLRYDFSAIDATKFYLKTRWDKKVYSTNFSDIIIADSPSTSQWLTNPNFNFHNLSASVGFHKKFQRNWDLFTNISFASRNPNPSEFFSDGLHHATAVIELGDLNLKQEKSTKFSLTFKKKTNSFSLEMNPYFNHIQNYIYSKPTGFESSNRGSFPVFEFHQTNAQLFGIDLQTHWDINPHWQHSFSTAYVNGKDKSINIPLVDMPPLYLNNKISFTKKEWNQLTLELKSEMVLQQNQFPDNNFNIIIIENNEFKTVPVDISTPPPAYNLLHFYSEMKFKTFKNSSTTIAFGIQNILNVSYRNYLNRQRFFADETGRNIQIQLKFNY